VLTSAGEWDGDKDGKESCLGWCLHVLAMVSLSFFWGQLGSSFSTCDEEEETSVPPLPLFR